MDVGIGFREQTVSRLGRIVNQHGWEGALTPLEVSGHIVEELSNVVRRP